MEETKNIKIVLAYDGTNYYGWQKQKNKQTVQGMIEDSIKKFTGNNKIKLNGSGRTDAGVHAIGQVANFKTNHKLPINKWPIVLNNILPDDIRIRDAIEVNMDFHARYSAISKVYRYCILYRDYEKENNFLKEVFLKNYFNIFTKKLDIARMRKTAEYLIGLHDFSALSCYNKKRGEKEKTRKRNISKIDIKKKKNIVYFSIEANTFLYKMVRIIIGTLIDFSINKREPKEIKEILNARDNQKSGKVVSPQGLYLVKVKY